MAAGAIMFGYGQPVDLLTGQAVDVDKSLAWSNDKEFHHFFPQAYLKRMDINANRSNVVGNIVLLSSASNLAISDRAPSSYLAEIIKKDGKKKVLARLASVLIPEPALDAALSDDFAGFLEARATYLHERAAQLAGIDLHYASGDADEMDESEGDPTE